MGLRFLVAALVATPFVQGVGSCDAASNAPLKKKRTTATNAINGR